MYVSITMGEVERHLRYDMQALMQLEREAGMTIWRLLSEQQAGVWSTTLFLWAGLKHEHPSLTVKGASRLIEDYLKSGEGDLTTLATVCLEALKESGLFPTLFQPAEAAPTDPTSASPTA